MNSIDLNKNINNIAQSAAFCLCPKEAVQRFDFIVSDFCEAPAIIRRLPSAAKDLSLF